MLKSKSSTFTDVPLKIVGGTAFGRYPKVSIEQTFNMLISDGFLVPFAGYKKIINILANGQGRAIYRSTPFDHMVLVVNNSVYIVNTGLVATRIGAIETFTGDVSIAENNAGEIAICDGKDIWVFNYRNDTFQKATIDFLPAYISFKDGYLIAAVSGEPQWQLSGFNDATSWPDSANTVGAFQTKPDTVQAVVPVPGRGNLVYVFGSTVTEAWYDTGQQLFPFQKNTFSNIDYGCLNSATIAANEEIMVWLAANEKSGPTIMFTTGGEPQQISNDGINYRLSHLSNPTNCYGFMFKQDGHLIYQITFPDPADNLSLAYDFTEQKFYTLTDQFMNHHIAKRVVFFNNKYYFISFNDGDLYELSSLYTNYDGAEIPRVRVTPTLRLPDTSSFIVNNITVLMESGNNTETSRVDISISTDGNTSFSNYVGMTLRPLGQRRNRFIAWNLGYANEMAFQFRFWSPERFVASNGVANIYQ